MLEAKCWTAQASVFSLAVVTCTEMDQTCLPLMSHVSLTNLRYLVYPTVTQQLMGRHGYLLPYYLISNDCAAVKWAAQIHLHKWMRPQRTHFKRTFHLWQQLPCNSPRAFKLSVITKVAVDVLLAIPPFLCQDLSLVLFVFLHLNSYDIRTAPHKSKTHRVDLKLGRLLIVSMLEK